MRAPENYYAVIMAGGGGTRLWPLSRKDRPKQMLAIVDERTLFQTAIDRLRPYFPLEQILVITIEDQFESLSAIVEDIPQDNFLVEPEPKGTASVIGLGALILQDRNQSAVMASLTADHIIQNEELFLRLLHAGYSVAAQNEIITLGVEPTEPATGYGYIRRGEKVRDLEEFEIREVVEFKEKPDRKTAEAYYRNDAYSWNSGMFIWSAERILKEIETHLPDLSQALSQIGTTLSAPEYAETLGSIWSGLTTETIDFGVMEKAKGILTIPTHNLGWQDLGGWDGLYQILEQDLSRNAIRADSVVTLDSRGNLIVQANGNAGSRLIAMLGVEDHILVDTEDVLFLAPRDRAQEIKKIIESLPDANMSRYL